jgi:hypothetical protein
MEACVEQRGAWWGSWLPVMQPSGEIKEGKGPIVKKREPSKFENQPFIRIDHHPQSITIHNRSSFKTDHHAKSAILQNRP